MTLDDLLIDEQLPPYLYKKLKVGKTWEAHGNLWLYIPHDPNFPNSTHHNISFRHDFKGNLIIQGHKL